MAELFEVRGPVVPLAALGAAGWSREHLRRLLAGGELIRLAKSAVVQADVHLTASPWERFRHRSLAFGLCSGSRTHLTGPAAAIVRQLPVLGVPPESPIGLRSGNAHKAPNVTVHGRIRWGYLPTSQQSSVAGVRLVGAEYTAIDIARHQGRLGGLLVADAVLHAGGSAEMMADLCAEMLHYPGIAEAAWVVSHADSRSESPVETLGRFAFLRAGRKVPLSNPWVWTEGRWFRVDHLQEDARVVIEADGAVKYNHRADADRVVTAEKERERLIRRGGLGMVRYTHEFARRRPEDLLRLVDEEAARVRNQACTAMWTLEPPW